jgi:hypothetical protein
MADLGNPFRLRRGAGGHWPEDPRVEPRDEAEDARREPSRLVAWAPHGSALAAALDAAQAAGPSVEELRALEARVLAGVGVATIAAVSVAAANQGTQAALGVGHAWLAAIPGKIAVGLVVAAVGAGGTVVALKRSAETRAHERVAAAPAPSGARARTRAPHVERLVAPAAPVPAPPAASKTSPAVASRLRKNAVGGPRASRFGPREEPLSDGEARVAPEPEAPSPRYDALLQQPARPAHGAVSARPSRSTGDAQSSTVEELRLLDLAERAVDSDPALALGLAEQHAHRFPSGLLGDERDVIEIAALVRLDRRGAARAQAAIFLRAHPGSAYSAKVRALAELDNDLQSLQKKALLGPSTP